MSTDTKSLVRIFQSKSFAAAFFQTTDSMAPTIIRIVLSSVLWAHGAQKLLGWFGGYGFEGTMGFFTGTVGLPWIIGFLVIVIEFFGSILLLFGFAARFWGIAMAMLMLGVALTSHIQNGFFINWLGNQKGEGIEYFLLAMAMSLSIIFTGAGRFSIDRLIMSMKTEKLAAQKLSIQL